MSPELELVRQGLERARGDLRSAELVLRGEPPVCESVCFFCQQVVEKALKAFLVHRRVDFEWTHLIAYLLDLCAGHDGSFEQWRDSASPLSEYAVRLRYPYRGPAPTPQQARRALDVA